MGVYSCDLEHSCCNDRCCSSLAYYGSGGVCSANPCSTTSTIYQVETVSTIVRGTYKATVTLFDTGEGEDEALPEYTCPVPLSRNLEAVPRLN